MIIGGGAAGLSAALVLSRARRSVAVVDAGEPRNAPASHMYGFLSRDGLPPSEFLAAGRVEVAGYGAELISATVTGITPRALTGYDVLRADGLQLTTRRIIVTTGLRDEIPDIPGLRASGGGATSCTVPTAMASRCATNRWAC